MITASVVLFAVMCHLLVFRAYGHLTKGRMAAANSKSDASFAILKRIEANDPSLSMSDVFSSLDQELVKCNMKLHTNLRGYLDKRKE